MTDNIHIRGFAATYPTLKRLPNGTPVANFRLASTPRWFDNASQSWKEGTTNWYTINAYRQLAYNLSRSVQIGQPLIISGKLKIKTWEREDGTNGQSVEIDTQYAGHDLSLGTSSFLRNLSPQAPVADDNMENTGIDQEPVLANQPAQLNQTTPTNQTTQANQTEEVNQENQLVEEDTALAYAC